MIKADEFISKAKSRIVILKRTETADGKGGAVVTWPELATVWAYLEPYSGRERSSQGALQSTFTTRVLIRYLTSMKNTAVTGKYKFTFDGRTFPIGAIKNLDENMTVEGKAFQEMLCTENESENAAG